MGPWFKNWHAASVNHKKQKFQTNEQGKEEERNKKKERKKREQEKFGYNNIKGWAVHQISFGQTWTAKQMDTVIPAHPLPSPNSNFVLWVWGAIKQKNNKNALQE